MASDQLEMFDPQDNRNKGDVIESLAISRDELRMNLLHKIEGISNSELNLNLPQNVRVELNDMLD